VRRFESCVHRAPCPTSRTPSNGNACPALVEMPLRLAAGKEHDRDRIHIDPARETQSCPRVEPCRLAIADAVAQSKERRASAAPKSEAFPRATRQAILGTLAACVRARLAPAAPPQPVQPQVVGKSGVRVQFARPARTGQSEIRRCERPHIDSWRRGRRRWTAVQSRSGHCWARIGRVRNAVSIGIGQRWRWRRWWEVVGVVGVVAAASSSSCTGKAAIRRRCRPGPGRVLRGSSAGPPREMEYACAAACVEKSEQLTAAAVAETDADDDVDNSSTTSAASTSYADSLPIRGPRYPQTRHIDNAEGCRVTENASGVADRASSRTVRIPRGRSGRGMVAPFWRLHSGQSARAFDKSVGPPPLHGTT
jgi:hypothetical protein